MNGPSNDRLPPWGRRLHALAGVGPLSIFLVLHVLANATALVGEEAFAARVHLLAASRAWRVAEVALVAVPLGYHALYGLLRLFWLAPAMATPDRGMRRLQGATGIATFLFVGYHLWHLRVAVLTGRLLPTDYPTELARALSTTDAHGIPLPAVAYLLGVAAASAHCALGLRSFCVDWGITESYEARRMASIGFGALAIALFLLAASTIMVFARGGLVDASETDVMTDLVAHV